MKTYLIILINICIMTVSAQTKENQTDIFSYFDSDVVKCEQIKGITYCYDNKENLLREVDLKQGSIKHFTNRKIIHNSYRRMTWHDKSIGSFITKDFMYKKKSFSSPTAERGLAEGYSICKYDEYGHQNVIENYSYDPETGEKEFFNFEKDMERIQKEFDSINALNPQTVIEKVLVYDKRDKEGYPLERKTTWGDNIELIKVNYDVKKKILHYKNYVNDVLSKEYIMQFNEQGLVVNFLDFVYDGTDFFDREQASHYWFEKTEYNKKGYLIGSIDYNIRAFNQVIKLRKEKGDTYFFEIMFQGKPEEYIVLEQGDIVKKQYNRKNNIIEVNRMNSVTNKVKSTSKVKYDRLDRIEKVVLYENKKISYKAIYEY